MDLGAAAEGIGEVGLAAIFGPPLICSLACVFFAWVGWAGRERGYCVAAIVAIGASQVWLVVCSGGHFAVLAEPLFFFRHFIVGGYFLLTWTALAWAVAGLCRCWRGRRVK